MRNDVKIDWDVKFSELGTDTNAKWNCLKDHTEPGVRLNMSHRKILRQRTYSNQGSRCGLIAKALSKVRKKHSAWKRYLQTKDGSEYARYKCDQNQVINSTRRSKSRYEREIAAKARINPKQFWRYVQQKTKSRVLFQTC